MPLKNVVQPRRPSTGARRPGAVCTGAALPELRRVLERAGARCGPGPVTSGMHLSVAAADGLAAAGSFPRFCALVHAALAGDSHLTLTIRGGIGHDAAPGLGGIFKAVAMAAMASGADSSRIDVVIDADIALPQVVWKIRQAYLPRARIYLRADARGMSQLGIGARGTDAFWSQLWSLRHDPGLQLAPQSQVTSPCPLLAFEHSDCVLPESGIQAPAGSAWLPITIDLLEFSDARGKLDWTVLANALETVVDVGDRMHDAMRWTRLETRRDAWLNRRLGVCIKGLGDLVARRGRDPAAFATLAELSELLKAIYDVLVARSRRLARGRDTLPAIRAANPARRLAGDPLQENWAARWRNALTNTTVAHRNLMVLSPWSLFPSCTSADIRYVNLVPVLALANACALGEPRSLATWTVDEFRNFHQYVAAVLQQNGGGKQIAEQV